MAENDPYGANTETSLEKQLIADIRSRRARGVSYNLRDSTRSLYDGRGVGLDSQNSQNIVDMDGLAEGMRQLGVVRARGKVARGRGRGGGRDSNLAGVAGREGDRERGRGRGGTRVRGREFDKYSGTGRGGKADGQKLKKSGHGTGNLGEAGVGTE